MRALLLLFLLALPMLTDAQYTQKLPLRQRVEGTWRFRKAGDGGDAYKPVQIPAGVHTALLQNKLIEDPFYRDNEEKLQWIEREDWEFECEFVPEEAVFQRTHVQITFKGIDTYAHIYLNDSLILETDNMFRTWTAEVKKYLKPGKNILHFYFDSPIKKVEPEWKALGYELPGSNAIRTMTRKAQFHYGWDWGPRMVGCGILKVPEICAWDDVLIEDTYVHIESITPERARLIFRVRYRSEISGPVSFVVLDNKRKSIDSRQLRPGVREDSVIYDLKNPKLWWCAGLGEPHLYDFTFQIIKNGRPEDQINLRTGIRTVELVTEKDANGKGESFFFRLNGVPVFAKGANYIPQDIFQERVTGNHYRRIIDDVVTANMNMLRVWGGGIYEEDTFYDLCDAKGILVWQDFMYACAMYPGNGKFLKNAAREALEQIERLRNHPCIALWCGNNENREGWYHWGWQMQFDEGQRTQIWRDYLLLFSDVLQTYVRNFANNVPYWESSPRYGRSNPKSNTEGDSHYWGVWHDEKPFEVYNKEVPRFMSEYGFQSFPEWRSILSFTLPEDRKLDSKVMLAHQKHPRGNALIAEYMKRDYRNPRTFEDFVYVSQVLQAEAMRTGIEAHRRNKPYCMGTLYWQLNDVWPGASWAGRDHEGRWKALHYFVRDAYTPLIALPYMEDDILKVFGVSDLSSDSTVSLRVRALTFSGKILSDVSQPEVKMRPDSSHLLWQGTLKTVLNGGKPDNAVVEIVLTNAVGAVVSRRLWYAVPPRKLNLAQRPGVELRVRQVDDGYELALTTDELCKNVLIYTDIPGFFSHNYFDLLPGERRTVLFKTERILDDPQGAFRVKHLAGATE
jgi:beta-mannosidase